MPILMVCAAAGSVAVSSAPQTTALRNLTVCMSPSARLAGVIGRRLARDRRLAKTTHVSVRALVGSRPQGVELGLDRGEAALGGAQLRQRLALVVASRARHLILEAGVAAFRVLDLGFGGGAID